MEFTDFRQRFIFDELDVRGCLVRLDNTCDSIQTTHHYPEQLASVLNEFSLAACLLRDSIKLDGTLTIQLRSSGPISLIMADCLSDRRLRAIAEYDNRSLSPNAPISLHAIDQGAVLAITVSPKDGERYQSIVPIEKPTLANCLSDYFEQSEQLPSHFLFKANQHKALGIALHALPPQKVTDQQKSAEHFNRLVMLLETLDSDEALNLSSQEILTRLYHEEPCRLFDAAEVAFGCECSAQRSLDAIAALGNDEVLEMIEEQISAGNEEVRVECHFCFQRYHFSFTQVTDHLKLPNPQT